MSDEQATRRVGVTTGREDSLLVSVREAAGLLGIGERTLWALIRDGEVPVVRLRARTLIARAHLEALATTSVWR